MTGQIASVIGSWTQIVTLNLLAYESTRSPAIIGLLNFLLLGPSIIAGPIGGAFVTAANAKVITTGLLLVALAVSIALSALLVLDLLTTPLLLVLAGVWGLMSALELPARQVLLTASIRQPSLVSGAISMNTLAFNVGRTTGPVLAAALVPFFGPLSGFACCMAGLLVMVFCVQRMRTGSTAGLRRSSADRMRASIAFVLRDRSASLLLPLVASIGLFAASYQTLVPVLAHDVYANAAFYTGIFYGAAGAGALVAAALLSSSLHEFAMGKLMLLAPLVIVGAQALLGSLDNASLAAVCCFLLGFGVTVTAPGVNAHLQQAASEDLRGALGGLYVMCFMGMIPFGQLLAGALAQAAGVRAAFCLLAAAQGTCLLILFYPRLRKVSAFTLDVRKL